MKLIEADAFFDPHVDIDQIYALIDDLFADDWRDHVDALASCMIGLRAEHRALRDLLSRHAMNAAEPTLQGAQSFLLKFTPRYGIRINLWFPETELARTNDRYRRYLSIDEMHNHDFSFLTICLSGPGYTSSFYRDRDFSAERQAGDRLDLAPAGEISLCGDRVLLVDRDLDYHAQHWPASFSTTLNLIPRDPHPRPTQYIVNRHDLTVREVARGEPQLAAA